MFRAKFVTIRNILRIIPMKLPKVSRNIFLRRPTRVVPLNPKAAGEQVEVNFFYILSCFQFYVLGVLE